MFEFVNEIAVLGTTFFMMAIGTLWYSPYLFQRPWMNAVGLTLADIENDQVHFKRNALITFFSYVIVIFLVALVIGEAQVLGVGVRQIAVGLSVAFAALLAAFVVWEQRSLTYYLVTTGFSTVFIIGSSVLLFYWPW